MNEIAGFADSLRGEDEREKGKRGRDSNRLVNGTSYNNFPTMKIDTVDIKDTII